MFAVIDIETTGGSYKYERIIEVAIVIHDGSKIIEKFESLVNPGILIPMHITRLTGIDNDMVKDAPKYHEIARTIVEMTEDKIFVAHNVNFDFGFIRKAFSDLAYNYNRKKLCTVKYSRQLVPGLRSYSLKNLLEHFNIDNNNAHRAMSDAYATAELLTKLLEIDKWNLFNKASRTNDVLVNMHRHLDKKVIKKLPKSAGIYKFYDEDGRIIYIGKSVNIHNRIISHLNNDKSARYIEMKSKIADIKYELSGSDLIAQLMESEMIKKEKPFYNRVLKTDSFKFGIYTEYDTKGYLNFSIKKTAAHSQSLISFANKQKARNFISRLQDQFGICFQENHITSNQQCLKYLNTDCLGMCQEKIEVEDYNKEFQNVIEYISFGKEEMLIELEGRNDEETGFVKISEGKYQGYGFIPNSDLKSDNLEISDYFISRKSDYDSRQIVKYHLFNEDFQILNLNQEAK